ncbi:MAG: haloacid dehalogenase-like hydrolase [Clostridia bacterium]|nr:haloacid dehalogenase-like hydrolase [Clostridia bacterium]
MRVFDFDNTVYDGESPFDVFIFGLRYRPRTVRYLLIVLYYLARYKLHNISEEKMEAALRRHVAAYVGAFADLPDFAEKFWDTHQHKIKSWYVPRPDDVFLTANFDVLIGEICRRLGITACISSTVDIEHPENMEVNFGGKKVDAFLKKYGNIQIDEFYTDSKYDFALIEHADKAFLVKGNKIKQIK